MGGVSRYLIVANRTLGGEHLLDEVRRRMPDSEATFHLVVPATPPGDHAWTEGEARTLARQRLDRAIEALRQLGADVDGEVGDANPLLAIDDAMRGQAFDEIILSTLRPGLSRWLKLDLPDRLKTHVTIPVTHIVGEEEPEPEPEPEG